MTAGYDIGRWARPPKPWPEDAERWASWCRDVVATIDRWRETEIEPVPVPQIVTLPAARPRSRPATDEACTNPGCTLDWLFTPNGPDDPAWRARVREEMKRAS